ncbi:MAG: YfhO family protein [Bacteroidales bacterium]|nr:YfhO family protein [Bacteroidales bacterium]
MKNITFKQISPYLIAIVIFVILAMAYLFPVFEGKGIQSTDAVTFRGAAQEIVDYREKTGEEPLWTNSMFSGMPAYLISTRFPANLISSVDKVLKLGLPHPMGIVFLYFLGFFILLLSLKVDRWISLIGAIGFALSSYFFIILEAGHNTKALAISYMAPVLAGIILTYRGKYLLGGILTALFLSLEINANHLQITYYLLIIVIFLAIAEIIRTIREKTFAHFFRASSILVVAALMAVAVNTSRLWTTYEQSIYSTRGKSELTFNKEDQTSGLDKSYATSWSYGIPETMTLLIPNLYGGSSFGTLGDNSATYRILADNNVPNSRQIMQQLPLYWGDQPFTSGPVYVGAAVLLLFIAGLFILRGPAKWWMLALTILSILLAWGHHFMPLTNFFMHYVPGYNKFRAVSMTLVIAEVTIPLLGFLALNKIVNEPKNIPNLNRILTYAFAILGGIALFILVFASSLFDFASVNDAQYKYPDWFMAALREDRMRLLRLDALRSLIFMGLTYALIRFYLSGKIKKPVMLVSIGLIILIDLWPVDRRYLNSDDFVRKSALEKPYQATTADQQILADKTLYFRVWNLTEDFDKSARTSYFHKNIGGYHAVKMKRYQELYDYHLSGEREKLVKLITERPDQQIFTFGLSQLKVAGMLNTKYFIYNPDAGPLLNPYALGNAWFVPEIRYVENADQEILDLNDFEPAKAMIVNQSFKEEVQPYSTSFDSTATIRLTHYQPNRLEYESQSKADQLAVFSEIYYPKGWNAYVDGVETPHFRANYVLRAMVLPAGSHKVEFRFEPRSYHLGETISLIFSLALILLLLAAIFLEIRRGALNPPEPGMKK